MSQSNVMQIMEREKEIPLEKLLVLCLVSRGSLSKVLKILIRERYIKKEIDPNDKRKRIIIYKQNGIS